jgi:hypothetical protein
LDSYYNGHEQAQPWSKPPETLIPAARHVSGSRLSLGHGVTSRSRSIRILPTDILQLGRRVKRRHLKIDLFSFVEKLGETTE